MEALWSGSGPGYSAQGNIDFGIWINFIKFGPEFPNFIRKSDLISLNSIIVYKRIFDIENQLDEGMFLFGARQTGKSTLLQERFPEAVYYDLLIDTVRKAFKRNPDTFRQALLAKPGGTLVIVDEIQKVPELLDGVHWLMVNRHLHFILSGSSARKLKRSGANTLGGRANPRTLFPLVWKEVEDFRIDKAVQNGMIPRHYMADDATDRLEGYVEVISVPLKWDELNN